MYININVFHRYKYQHFLDNDAKENFEQKLSIDETHNTSRAEIKLIILFC